MFKRDNRWGCDWFWPAWLLLKITFPFPEFVFSTTSPLIDVNGIVHCIIEFAIGGDGWRDGTIWLPIPPRVLDTAGSHLLNTEGVCG